MMQQSTKNPIGHAFLSLFWNVVPLALVIYCLEPRLLAQERNPLTTRFNECGVSDEQARYFLTHEARLAMGSPRPSRESDSGYRETLFFAGRPESGLSFVTQVLRAGGLSNASRRVLADKSLSSAEELHSLLLKLSVPTPSPNLYGKMPIVVQEVQAGTKPSEWPDSARNGFSDWNEPYRNGWDDSSSVYSNDLNVVVIFDEACRKPMHCGILRDVYMFQVSDHFNKLPEKVRASASKSSPPISVSIWYSSIDSITLRGDELMRCAVFRLSPSYTGLSGSTKTGVAASLPATVSECAANFSVVNTRDSSSKVIFADEDKRTNADLRDFDSYLSWAAAVIGPSLRGQVIDKVQQERKRDLEIFNDSPRYPHLDSAYSKYLQILQSAKSWDVVVPPEPNGIPNPASRDANGNSESGDNKVLADVAGKLTKEIVKINVDKASNMQEVKTWVDAKIAGSIAKNANIPESQKGIVATLEQSLEGESKLITRSAIFAKGLFLTLDVHGAVKREDTLKEIAEFARKGDVYSAWKTTLSVSLDMGSEILPGKASPLSALSPILSEVLAEATVDIYVPLGNRIAWWMWENGYSPRHPRFAKDQFDNGVTRPKSFESNLAAGPIPPPTVPAVPNGVPVPTKLNDTADVGKPPIVVPPSVGGRDINRRPDNDTESPHTFQVPFVPIVTPNPLPPRLYKNSR